MSCWDCISAGIREQEAEQKQNMLVFKVEGPMPEGLVQLCKMWGLFNAD